MAMPSILLPCDFFFRKTGRFLEPASQDKNAKSTKWWKLQFDSGYISYIPWTTNITDMPVVHFAEIDVEQNHQSHFLHHGLSQYHCIITDDNVNICHDSLQFEDLVYLYAFHPASTFSDVVKLDSVILDFYDQVNLYRFTSILLDFYAKLYFEST